MQTGARLLGDVKGFLQREGAGEDFFLEARSVDELDREEAVLFVDFEDSTDVVVVKGSSGLGFAEEAIAVIGRQELECNGPAEFGVFGPVDNTHAALAELFC